jgi:hypothetical protein
MDMISVMKVLGRETFLALELDSLDAKQRAIRTCHMQRFARAVIENGAWYRICTGRLAICGVSCVLQLSCGGVGGVDMEEVKERDGELLSRILYCPCCRNWVLVGG